LVRAVGFAADGRARANQASTGGATVQRKSHFLPASHSKLSACRFGK
jgi:hypothetical protein